MPEPEGLPHLEDLPMIEILERILVLADEVSGLKTDKAAMVDEVLTKLEKVREIDRRQTLVFGALRHTIRAPLSRMKAAKYLKQMADATPTVKAVVILFLAGAASFGVAAGYTRPEASPVLPFPSTALEMARDELRKGEHREALKYYKQVPDPSPEVLFRKAECQFRLNEYDDALATCEVMDVATGGTCWESPLVRGWICQRRGQKIMAATWYKQAARRGYPDGEALAAGVK